MRMGAVWRDASILDLSSRGLMIQAGEPLPGGSYVELRRGRHLIVARVIWSDDRRSGLRTQDVLPTDAIIAEPENCAGKPFTPQHDRRVDGDRDRAKRAVAHDQSRLRGRAFEFAAVALIGAVCGSIAYRTVGDMLSRPLDAVEIALAGK